MPRKVTSERRSSQSLPSWGWCQEKVGGKRGDSFFTLIDISTPRRIRMLSGPITLSWFVPVTIWRVKERVLVSAGYRSEVCALYNLHQVIYTSHISIGLLITVLHVLSAWHIGVLSSLRIVKISKSISLAVYSIYTVRTRDGNISGLLFCCRQVYKL